MRDSKKDKAIILAHIGVGGQKGYIYKVTGICPCLPATQYKDPCKVLEDDNRKEYQTYSENGLAPTIAAGTHGYCVGHILVKVLVNGSKSNSTDGQHDRPHI